MGIIFAVTSWETGWLVWAGVWPHWSCLWCYGGDPVPLPQTSSGSWSITTVFPFGAPQRMRGLCCKPPKTGFFAGWERGRALRACLEAGEGRANVRIVSEESIWLVQSGSQEWVSIGVAQRAWPDGALSTLGAWGGKLSSFSLLGSSVQGRDVDERGEDGCILGGGITISEWIEGVWGSSCVTERGDEWKTCKWMGYWSE